MDLPNLSIGSKTESYPMVVFDLDDFAQDWESNPINWLIDFKRRSPNLKVTLFTILGRWDKKMLKQLNVFDWIELAAHGYTHIKNSEVVEWDRKQWFDVINEYENTGIFTKVFKAPNWEMSTLGYHVLKDCGWAVAIRQFQIKDLPSGMRYYCFETTPSSVHGHTWTMEAHSKEGKFVGWCNKTNFQFVSENLETKP